MENLGELIRGYVDKIQELNEKLILLNQKKENLEDLNILNEKVHNCRNICDNAKYTISNSKEMIDTYTGLMNKAAKQQFIMLKIIEKIDEKKISLIKKPAPSLIEPQSNLKSFEIGFTTPKMCLKQYMQSPLISRVKAISLSFTDFDIVVNSDDFAKVPSYLRGRDTCDDLNNFLTSVVIKCFTDKYTLACKKREAVLRPNDLNLWLLYQQQRNVFPNKKFITDGDISRVIEGLISKKMYTKISMLKHLHIIKEFKKNATNYYIWEYNNEN